MASVIVERTSTWRELLKLISEKSGVVDFDLKYGYPPQTYDTQSIDGDVKLQDLPQKLDGEQLIVTPRVVTKSISEALNMDKHVPTNAQELPATPKAQHQSPDKPLNLTRKPKPALSDDPPIIPVPQLEGVMVLRVMPDDNSCMFRALSAAVLGSALDGMTELRSVVAQQIQENPELYTAGVLEKSPTDYCRWIQREDSWGGGIELAILSQHFDIEVCSINVQDLRVDKFNEGRPTRCVLVYSGIHYDVCAVTPHAGADPDFDRKVFDVVKVAGDEMDGGALEAAVELCRGLQKQHYFTDTHAFSLKCGQCGEQGNGQQWAVQHARQTGHGDFGEA